MYSIRSKSQTKTIETIFKGLKFLNMKTTNLRLKNTRWGKDQWTWRHRKRNYTNSKRKKFLRVKRTWGSCDTPSGSLTLWVEDLKERTKQDPGKNALRNGGQNFSKFDGNQISRSKKLRKHQAQEIISRYIIIKLLQTS